MNICTKHHNESVHSEPQPYAPGMKSAGDQNAAGAGVKIMVVT